MPSRTQEKPVEGNPSAWGKLQRFIWWDLGNSSLHPNLWDNTLKTGELKSLPIQLLRKAGEWRAIHRLCQGAAARRVSSALNYLIKTLLDHCPNHAEIQFVFTKWFWNSGHHTLSTVVQCPESFKVKRWPRPLVKLVQFPSSVLFRRAKSCTDFVQCFQPEQTWMLHDKITFSPTWLVVACIWFLSRKCNVRADEPKQQSQKA